jgi:hypothetical protein
VRGTKVPRKFKVGDIVVHVKEHMMGVVIDTQESRSSKDAHIILLRTITAPADRWARVSRSWYTEDFFEKVGEISDEAKEG